MATQYFCAIHSYDLDMRFLPVALTEWALTVAKRFSTCPRLLRSDKQNPLGSDRSGNIWQQKTSGQRQLIKTHHFGSLQQSLTRLALLSVDPVRCDLIGPSLLPGSEHELLLQLLFVELLLWPRFFFFVSAFLIPPSIWIRPPPAAPRHLFWEQVNGLRGFN